MGTTKKHGGQSFKGSLLLADPGLLAPTFRRTVLLLTDHGATFGAHGYILNRPLDKQIGELLEGPEFEPLGEVPVFFGGPVSREHLTFGSFTWDDGSGQLVWNTHLSAQEARRHLEEGFSVRAFVGYSGWSEGQLESELREKSWITRDPQRNILDMRDLDHLWMKLMQGISPWHALQAGEPENPSLN